MTGFSLPNNYIPNPEALLRKNKSCAASSSTIPPTHEPVTPVPSATTEMAKSLRDYSTPAVANVPIGPAVNTGTGNFELRTGLITMVQAKQFCGFPSRMQVHTCNTSLIYAKQSSSKTSHQLALGSVYFPSPSWGRRNSGSIRKRKQSVHGTNVPQHSS